MPPFLALFLCTVFVLFLLRLEHKQSPNVSLALWIPTIWMLYITSKPLAIWFGFRGADVESGSPLDRTFLVGLLCMELFVLARRGLNRAGSIKGNIWLILLIGYTLVSVLWSDIPFISFKRWSREFIAVVMAFSIATEGSPRQAMESIFRRSAYILIPFSIVLIKYFPHYGVMYTRWEGTLMWIGVTMHKNGLGLLCLITGFFLIWSLIRGKQRHDTQVSKYQTCAEMVLLITTFWLLKGPGKIYSVTSITTLAAGLGTLFGLFWMKKRRTYFGTFKWVAVMAFIIAFGTVTPMVGGSNVVGFASEVGRDATLTGRTEIWAGLLPIFYRHPILGCGFGGFWTTRTIEEFRVNEAHNGYLEVLVELGLVGLLLVSLFFLSSCWYASRELTHDFYWGSLWICLLLMVLVHNISEATINSFSRQSTAVILFLAFSTKNATSYTAKVSRNGKS